MLKCTKQELITDCTSGFEAWMRFKTAGDRRVTICGNGKTVVMRTDYGCKRVRPSAAQP